VQFRFGVQAAMNVMKSCLAIFGLMILLLLGSCVLGTFGLVSLGRSVMAEQSGESKGFTQTVSAKPDLLRSALYDFFESATYERLDHPVTVNNMSDGSVQMVMGSGKTPMLTIDVKIVPSYGDYSSVTVSYDATALAATRAGGPSATAIQSELYKRLSTAFEEIEGKGATSRGLTISSVLTNANKRYSRYDGEE
jgi:hypothetical protein